MLSFACGTRDKVHMRRPAPAPPPRSSHPKCVEQSSAHRLFLPAKARWKFGTDRLTLLNVVDANPTQKPYWDRKVPGTARVTPGTYELYREFRTNRRPLNVASVVSRTARAGKFICAGRHPGSAGDRTRTTTASCLDRHRRRTARFLLGRIYGGRPPRSWPRCRYMPTGAEPSHECPGDRAS